MNHMEQRIVAELGRAINDNDAAHLTHAELRHLKAIVAEPSNPVALPPLSGSLLGQLGGVPIVVDHPKGYPTTVTPRERKQRRRR